MKTRSILRIAIGGGAILTGCNAILGLEVGDLAGTGGASATGSGSSSGTTSGSSSSSSGAGGASTSSSSSGGGCAPNEKLCAGACVPDDDPAHGCAAAGCTACATNEVCAAGACAPAPCVAEIAAGGSHTCARKGDGTLWCWGANASGQLGNGTTCTPFPCGTPSPAQVAALGASIVEIAAGGVHSCARKGDGTLWCWGNNQYGQLGDGTASTSEPSPVQVTALGANVVEIAAGELHTCARKSDGTVWCWGNNGSGEIGDGTTCMGIPCGPSLPVQVTALGASVVEIAAGGGHSCARKGDGTLWCWGTNQLGQLGDGTKTDSASPIQVKALGASVVEIAAGEMHTCARKADGTLWCWGYNEYGEIGDGTSVPFKLSPVQVTALGASVVEITAGELHTCARKGDGTLWCWGGNQYGPLGDGTTCATPPCGASSPVQVTALGASVVEISAGSIHTCAREGDGTLWCWGYNHDGEIGDGTTDTPKPSPVMALLTCP